MAATRCARLAAAGRTRGFIIFLLAHRSPHSGRRRSSISSFTHPFSFVTSFVNTFSTSCRTTSDPAPFVDTSSLSRHSFFSYTVVLDIRNHFVNSRRFLAITINYVGQRNQRRAEHRATKPPPRRAPGNEATAAPSTGQRSHRRATSVYPPSPPRLYPPFSSPQP